MGNNRNVAIGLGVIAVIIVIIVGVAMAAFPGETKPDELEKNQPTNTQNKIIDEQTSDVEFDPEGVKVAEKNIPEMQLIFREVLKRCNAVESYSDYLTLGTSISILQDEMVQSIVMTDRALTAFELLGYDEHPTVGPLIKETRQLIGDSGDCLRDLVNKYEN